MTVRADRCPHCWAALALEVGPACPHCRKSLLPTGRKARKAVEQERSARAQRPENGAPQQSHPHQPHPHQPPPPTFVAETQPAPAAVIDARPPSAVEIDAPPPPEASEAPPDWATPTPLPPIPPPPSASGTPTPTPSAAWGTPTPAPPAAWGTPTPTPPSPPLPSGGRRRGLTVLLVVVGILGSVGGRFAVDAVLNGIEKVSGSEESAGAPVVYDGPTFSVQLPGSVEVQHLEEADLQLTVYGAGTDESYVAVSVMELGPDGAYDFAAGAEGIRDSIGGRIASDTPVDVAGRPAHDLVVTGVKGGKATSWTRIIVDDFRVYQIAGVLLGNHTEPSADYVAALNSFVMR